MSRTSIVIYQEKVGEVPLLDGLDDLSPKLQDKCIEKIERLAMNGYELRRPHCDILEQGIYELRARYKKIHYRILYAFVGRNVVLLSHGCFKTAKVPKKEIRRAISNLEEYKQNPEAHTYEGEL